MSPVVVLHGFTGCGATMRSISEPLSAEFDVVAPDLAGHGVHTLGLGEGDCSVDAMAKTVLASLDEPCHVVGYSMGGRVALNMATLEPHRVASLSLIGASAGIAGRAERVARAEADDLLASLIERDLDAFVDQWMANPLFASQARLGPDFLKLSRAQRLANNAETLARSLREASTGRMRPLHAELSTLTMAVGLIVGGEDLKFRAIAADLVGRLPNARVHVIAGSGHGTHLEYPEQTIAAILATIEKAS